MVASTMTAAPLLIPSYTCISVITADMADVILSISVEMPEQTTWLVTGPWRAGKRDRKREYNNNILRKTVRKAIRT